MSGRARLAVVTLIVVAAFVALPSPAHAQDGCPIGQYLAALSRLLASDTAGRLQGIQPLNIQ